MFWPQLLTLRAETLFLAGRTDEAAEVLDRALRLAGEGTWDSAVAKVLMADLLAARGDTPGAVAILAEAVDESRHAAARMVELHAATRLARLANERDRRDAIARVRALLDTFTDGANTPDLIEAREAISIGW